MAFDEGDEANLIDRALAGDADAFSEIFQRYYSMIYAFAYRLCFDKADAQDVAQETFVKAARSLGSFRRKGSFKHWLYRIAWNTGHDSNRDRARRSRLADALGGEVADSPRSPDYTEIHRALASLSDDFRRAVTLVFFEGMNHAEAARVLGCAEATVSWRVFMAKQKLKRLLKAQ